MWIWWLDLPGLKFTQFDFHQILTHWGWVTCLVASLHSLTFSMGSGNGFLPFGNKLLPKQISAKFYDTIWHHLGPWASYQIRKIAGCACTGNAKNFFPATDFKGKPLVSDPDMHHGTYVTHVPWCMSGSPTRGGGENFPGIPDACATRNFIYLARGPLI